jgi:hypothetical protein
MRTHPWKVAGVTACAGLLGLCGCMARQEAILVPAPGQVMAQEAAPAEASPAADEAPPVDNFRFPDDQGGKLLAKLLVPPEKPVPPPAVSSGPRQFPGLSSLEQPAATLTPPPAAPPQFPLAKPAHGFRPDPPAEETPLLGYRGTPAGPHDQYLPAGELVRLPSPDVNRPAALPPLAQPVLDRASLDDPTSAASLDAALAAPVPQRSTPAPFLRLSLPDPFEHRQTVKLRAIPPEDLMPVAASPRLPRP